nr:hypothetical protein [Tanacetum cinerariifolium]
NVRFVRLCTLNQDCPKCGNQVDGLYCRHCAILQKKLKEHKFSKDFLNTFESSNDDSNVVNIPQEPIVFNQDLGENLSQSPPQIDHHCCYGCGDSLDGIFCQQCTCKSCGNGAHHGYNCPPKAPIISNPEPCHDQNVEEFPQTLPSFHPTCYSRDENYDSTPNLVNDSPNVFNPPSQPPMYSYEFYSIIFELPSCIAIIPVLSTKEPKDSLIMGDEHLDTIPEKESDEFIKSSVENLVPNPSESEDECECDVRIYDDFTIFSNLLFDADDDFSSSDDEIDEADCDPEEEIRLIEKLLYDNSSPRPPEEFISKNSDTAIKSFSPSPIPAEDSDSLIEEIELSFTSDDSMPPGIENDDYDSQRDILILEELLSNDSLPLPENESFHFNIPSSPRPLAKPPDDDEIEPNSRILTIKVVGDISEHYVPMPRLLPTQPTLASNQEKSPHLLSHRGLKAF